MVRPFALARHPTCDHTASARVAILDTLRAVYARHEQAQASRRSSRIPSHDLRTLTVLPTCTQLGFTRGGAAAACGCHPYVGRVL